MNMTFQIKEVDIRPLTWDTIKTIKSYDDRSQAIKDMYKPTKIYVSLEGETIWENLEKRRQRPYTIFKKEVIPAVLEKMGLPATTKVRWSQYAGCSCPCSPGFIVDNHYGTTVYATVTE